MSSINKCPCGTGRDYESCCGLSHSGEAFAPTAEQLMRSRYSAFALNNTEYLAQTWHPKTRPRNIRNGPERTWTSLTIDSVVDGSLLHDAGVVAFTATFIEHGQVGETSQVSEFERIDGKWVYVDEQA